MTVLTEHATGTPPARVRVLGSPEIVDADTSREPLRAKALELLVYLSARDGHAHQETILDELLPDAPASRAKHQLHTYVSNLRQPSAAPPATAPTCTTPAIAP